MGVKNGFSVWGMNTGDTWESGCEENMCTTERQINKMETITEWGPPQFVFFTNQIYQQGEQD
jgi:hypothetical protein